MFKFVVLVAALCLATASISQAGLIQTHEIVHEPVLAKVGSVVHSVPSAVSHQSITQVHHNKHVIQPILAPVVKTTLHAAPVVHEVHHAPIVHSVPVHHSHAVPVVKSVVASPLVYTLHH